MRLIAGLAFYCLSLVFVWRGIDKMLNYHNPSSSLFGDPVNVYVGGDAYNYIINSNYTGAFFTLALVCALIGSTILILGKLEQLRLTQVGVAGSGISSGLDGLQDGIGSAEVR